MNQRTAPAISDMRAPTQQELFERLSQVASDLSDKCTRVEHALSREDRDLDVAESTALQDLDRMTQHLFELSKLMRQLSQSEHKLPEDEIAAALNTVMLPSLRSFLQDGEEQQEQGSVELF